MVDQTSNNNKINDKTLQGAENGNFCAFSMQKDKVCNLDIVMIGYAGLSGSVKIAEEKKQELHTRYASIFLNRAIEEKAELFGMDKILMIEKILREAAAASGSDECKLYELGKGGVFMGLWNIAQAAGVGLEVILKQIPVKQETIEICNFYDVNPYQLKSDGSYLLFSEHGNRIVQNLTQEGIPACVIGITTDKKDRVIRNGEEKRFLEKKYEEALSQIK